MQHLVVAARPWHGGTRARARSTPAHLAACKDVALHERCVVPPPPGDAESLSTKEIRNHLMSAMDTPLPR
eukprot:15456592-Alexandrium_andersonii.AAC.1